MGQASLCLQRSYTPNGGEECTWQDTRYVLGYFGKKPFFYWVGHELGISGTYLAKRLGMSQSGVVYAMNKGEKAAKEKNYQLVV